MPLINRALAALKRVAIVIGITIAFSVGLIGALVLSLTSSQTRVPDVVGRDRAAAEDAISAAHLNFRVRATRPASGARPNTVLIQIPGAGEEVKVGQTVAVDLSRPAKEGESPVTASPEDEKPANTAERANFNSNENKPRRNKNTNKALNDNQNANSNRNANSSNSNSKGAGNRNLSPTETSSNNSANSNNRRSGVNLNRSNGNSNTNRRRPVTSPTPD